MLTHARRRQRAAAGAAIDDAKQRPNRNLDAVGKPRAQQLPAPLIHPDLATLVNLAMTHKDRAPSFIEIALSQRQRPADPQPGTPQHHDRRQKTVSRVLAMSAP